MATVKISYPQLVVDSKEIEISQENLEKLDRDDINAEADFVYNHLTDQEQNWLPQGKQSIINAIDIGYAKIDYDP